MKALCILLFTCSFMVLGYTPAFEKEVQLYCGGTPIDCTYYGSPASYDWNGDGAKDLMVGQHGGEIRLFLNEGTSSSPVFNSWSYMQADGVNIDVLSS
jgi:hypothetical protein